ncbi:spore maturation protein [Clostridium baratii]|uniref:Spore maturation protein B n=3 Tax=Clostridium TaxID=1485 RepID=A0A0A7FU12_9CLOT|nr:nucleoside recognition domain-containing protein [Clostridium baratii]AIY83102.1 spore maturation protein B [Clostridium baratii str. Sullivan]KJU71920.1 spore maturation protein [Clostridium baratii]MBS6007833.1 spore maturation protein [Clostridium baratii]MBS6041414.1 spore maturation protein [Clostridium baratii]MBT9830894.1 spore maturation protein [Clostridium baratii]
MLFNFTKSIIPITVVIILGYGMIKGRKVYEWFLEGAKDGLMVCLKIFPCLLAMLVAVQIFKNANLLDLVNKLVAPLSGAIGLPQEVVPLVLIKPISGSGAIGMFTDIIKTYGADTFIGLVASVIMGTTETIFYTITVYYGAAKIKKIRHTLWAAVIADITAIIVAIFVVNWMLL